MKKNKELIFGRGMEAFLGIALMLGLLLPHTSNAFMVVNPILCVLFILIKGKSICRYGLVPIIAICISLLINAFGAATGKAILMAIAIILCVAAFPMTSKIKIKNIYIYLSFGAIFLSQVAYMLNISFVANFVDTYYPIGSWGEDFITRTIENVNMTNYLEFRQGGLYRNPNHLAKYVTFLLAIFLVNNSNASIKRLAWFSAFCFFSIILTGSRTGFVIIVILIVFALVHNNRSTRAIRITVTATVFCLLLYVFFTGGGGRATAVEAGIHDSAGLKFLLLLDYLSHEANVFYYLFGHLDYSLFKGSYITTYSLDSEYGYIIYCFGFFGFFALIYYFYKIYQHVDKPYRLFLWVMLWMISSTIIMSYRAIFVFMLLLSTIYNPKKIRNDKIVRTAKANKQV